MLSSNADKKRGWRVALAALTFGVVAALGTTASSARADEGWHRGWEHHDWDRDRGWDRDRHSHGWGWHQPRWYSYGWYDPPVVYAPAPPPAVYAPPAYYPGGLSVYIPLR